MVLSAFSNRSLLKCAVTRAVPRIFCLRGQTPHTFTGVSRIQTVFLVGRFVFTPTQKVASKTFKETNHTDTFFLIVMIYYGINTLFGLKLPPRSLLHNDDLYTIFNSSYTVNRSLTLCMDGFKNGLKAFVSLNRDWLEGTELKLQVSVSEYQVSKTSLY